MPRVYDVETYYSDGKHPYYQLCYQFLQEKYVYGEGYSLEPFKEFYEKVFSNDLLKKSFTQSVFSYLKDVGIDINQPSLPSQRKAPMLFANIKAAKFVGDSGEAGKIWLIRMLAYQFIRYLQKNPDFFRQLVVRSKTQ
ncbi:MAG: hypothetical protein LBU27_03595 [Candidatus Peribacteria bacterium]|jgi:hypothetical protein|nr:hypothetical protein [Candidatus Peribacteria bacterium]